MPKGLTVHLSAAAAAELGRQAAVAGTPGLMHLDLVEGGCERWVLRIRPRRPDRDGGRQGRRHHPARP